MFIDTHSHLNFKSFSKDYRETIKRAFDAGVKGIVNVGSNLETSEKAIKIAHEFPEEKIYAAVGLHPIHVNDEDFDYQKYLELAYDKKVVAIGETGVDLYHLPRLDDRVKAGDKNNIDSQRDVFEKSLKIARLLGKPVIMHCRDGEDYIRAWLMGQKNLPKGVFHCFSGNRQFAEFVLDLGFYLSFTGIITFTKSPQILEIVKNAPLDKIMIETDCPYLTPEPYRGKRNEPAYVVEVAKKIAEIKKIPLSDVEEATTLTAKELFGII